MNMITGCLAATEGTASVCGHDIFEEPVEAKRCIGYLPEIPPLYPEMTPQEYLNFVAKAKGITKEARGPAIAQVMEKTGITQMKDRLIKHLSKGYKQRVGIAYALLGDPELIILDEPTVGLDPKQIIEIRNLILSLKGRHTVILSSHILSEVQAVCDRILIISHGKMVASDTAEALETMFAGHLSLALRVRASREKFDMIVCGVPGVKVESYRMEEDGVYGMGVLSASGETDPDMFCEQVFTAFAGAKCPILSMNLTRASLEDIFLTLTSEQHEEELRVKAAAEAAEQEKAKQGKTDFDTLGVSIELGDEKEGDKE